MFVRFFFDFDFWFVLFKVARLPNTVGQPALGFLPVLIYTLYLPWCSCSVSWVGVKFDSIGFWALPFPTPLIQLALWFIHPQDNIHLDLWHCYMFMYHGFSLITIEEKAMIRIRYNQTPHSAPDTKQEMNTSSYIGI